MSELIVTKDGSPFENERVAALRQGAMKRQGLQTTIVEVEGGFALQKEDSETPDETPRRPERIPLGTRNRLRYPKRKGYYRRVFNDKDDRIQRALEAGYEFVTDHLPGGDPRTGDPSQVGSHVAKEVGGGMKGYLMEIPIEYYKEDQKAKQDRITLLEAQMKRDKTDGISGLYGKVAIER